MGLFDNPNSPFAFDPGNYQLQSGGGFDDLYSQIPLPPPPKYLSYEDLLPAIQQQQAVQQQQAGAAQGAPGGGLVSPVGALLLNNALKGTGYSVPELIGSQSGFSLSSLFGGGGGAASAVPSAAPAVPTIVGATPTTGALGAGSGVGASLGAALPYAAGAAGAYGLYDLAKNPQTSELRGTTQGAASGAALGFSLGGPVGAGIGAAAGGIYGFLSSGTFGSKKGKDQIARDKVRKNLVNAGALGKDYKLQLTDGKSFDIGKDGKSFATHSDVDFSKQGIGDVVAAVNPLAAIITGGDKKLQSDFAGYFTNAADTAQTPQQKFDNAKAIIGQLGFDQNTLHQGIEQLANSEDEKKRLTPEERQVYHGSIDALFSGALEQRAQQAAAPKPQPTPDPKPQIVEYKPRYNPKDYAIAVR